MRPSASSRIRLGLALLAFAFAAPVLPQPATLVRDLNQRIGATRGSLALQGFAGLRDRAIFTTATGPTAPEATLWSSDGTEEGTSPLPIQCGSQPCTTPPRLLGEALGLAFLAGGRNCSGSGSSELWRTDGTAAGTYLLFAGLGEEGAPVPFSGLQAVGRLVFQGCGEEGCGLWGSDGTPAGTRFLIAGDFTQIVAAGRAVYALGFLNRGFALYRSDGTLEGTRKVRDLPHGEQPRLLTGAGPRVFFLAGGDGTDLWTSDGTRGGTFQVEAFFDTGSRYSPPTTNFLLPDGEGVLFVAERRNGPQLWRSNGSRSGTKQLTAFPRGLYIPSPRQIVRVADQIVFRFNDRVTGPRLWQSRLTLESTAPLAGCPGGCPSLLDDTPLVALGSRLYFGGRDLARGSELWVSDGTGPGTRPVRDLCAGPCDAAPFDLRAIGGALYAGVAFAGRRALVRSDGTEAGTAVLARLPDSAPPLLDLAALGSRFLFAGFDAGSGAQPWITDGTAAGARLLRRLAAPAPSSDPAGLLTVGSTLILGADDGFERGLWASDGASLAPLTPTGSLGAAGPEQLTLAGPYAYFVARPTLASASELWRSDGTAAGTLRLTTFSGKTLRHLTALRGELLFLVSSDDASQPAFTLWSSDGSAGGTRQRLALPEDTLDVPRLQGTGEEILFPLEREVGTELFWSDGGAGGTGAIVPSDCFCGTGIFRESDRPVRWGGSTYFVQWAGGDGFSGPALWRTDGTLAGTARVVPAPGPPVVPRLVFPRSPFASGRDLLFLAFTPRVDLGDRAVLFHLRDGKVERLATAGARRDEAADPQFTPAGDRVFLRAYDQEHGYELWVTDGTKAGTQRVRDLVPGAAGSDPQGLLASGGWLYFSAFDPEHGRELWRSDGTEAGTRLVQDLAPGPASSRPDSLAVAGDRLYFSADDGTTGRELWSLPLGAPPL